MDIETFGNDLITPYCLCLIYKNRKIFFYGIGCVSSGLHWIFDFCLNNTIFYIHNLDFDGNVILNFLPSGFELDPRYTILRRGDFYCMCLSKDKKRIFFKCSAKIFPLSLEDIGYKFNVGLKQIVNHGFANESTIDDPIFKSDIIRYCKNDTVMVSRFLEKIGYSIGILEKLESIYSMSGLSLNIFKKNFNFFNIPLKNSIEFDNLLRPGYYGGRCEVFGNLTDSERCYHFDFSGMYTNRLLEEYPFGEYEVLKEVEKIENNGFYFVSVFSDLELPILPYRDEGTGRLLFPNGFFYGLYWGEELLLFLENGGVVEKIHYAIVFKERNYIFKEFGEYCSKARKKSEYDKILWKLIPNSFIGRLGLKYDDEETLILADSDYNPRSLDVICDKKINNNWIVRIRKNDNSKKNTANVMYPGIITSKARILWWKSAKNVIENKGRILYCDTDSIFAGFDKKDNPIGKTHGSVYWDPDKKDTILDDACFATNKVYCIVYDNNTVVKIKGISKKYIGDFTIENFKDYFFKGRVRSFKTLNFEKNKLDIKITELNKMIDFSFYDKRIFDCTKTKTSSLFIKKIYYPI